MEILIYFLKSAACLAVLLLFYKLLLEKEDMHVFKRFYLLLAVVISLIIPFITFTTYVEAVPQEIFYIAETSYQATSGEIPEQDINYWPYVLWAAYGLGGLFFSLIFIRNLWELFLKINQNIKEESNGITYVLLEEAVTPHTFWSYIFVNKQKFIEGSIPQEVFEHEQAHAKQKHSIDILFMEFLQIVLWFYPLIYLVKNAIKLNHEFLADRAVITKGVNTIRYQHTLLAFSSNAMNSSLVNSINYSSIKKRFTVMKTKTSRRTIWIRSILALPLLVVLIYGFSATEEVQKPLNELKVASDSVQEKSKQKEVTAEMLREYDSLVNHYNSKENSIIKQRDLDKMDSIYAQMTSIQQERAAKRKFKLVPPLKSEENNETQKKATPEMLREYDSLVKHYNFFGDKAIIKQRDMERMNLIYNTATPKQKRKVVPRKFTPHIPMPSDWSKEKEVSPEMIEEYNKLVRQYRSRSEATGQQYNLVILRIRHIYGLMTAEQKRNAEELPPNLVPTSAVRYSEAQSGDGGDEVPETPAPDKKLSLFVHSKNEILVNGHKTNLQSFAELIDETTEDWIRADYDLHGLEIKISDDVPKNLIDQLNAEFKETNLADYLNSDAPYIPYFITAKEPPQASRIESFLTEDSKIYLEGKIISAKEALELYESERDKLKISIQQNNEHTTILMEYHR